MNDEDKRINALDDEMRWLERNAHSILFKDAEKRHKLVVLVDNQKHMAAVFLNEECLHCGNFDDFHPGCHGGFMRVLSYLYGEWSSYHSLAAMICRIAPGYMSRPSYKVTWSQSECKWKDAGEWAKKRTNTVILKTEDDER